MYVYKEVWVHPVARWLWLMQDIAGPALLEGHAPPGPRTVELSEATTAHVISLDPDADGAFRAFVPSGEYTLAAGEWQARVTLLPGGTHRADLRPGRALDFALESETSADGEVTIRVTARGDGLHTFVLRAENLDVDTDEKTLTLRPDAAATLEWRGKMISIDAPWVAVVVPDDDVTQRRDAVGALPRPTTPAGALYFEPA